MNIAVFCIGLALIVFGGSGIIFHRKIGKWGARTIERISTALGSGRLRDLLNAPSYDLNALLVSIGFVVLGVLVLVAVPSLS